MASIISKIIVESWTVLGQMAPYLLLGFLIAGILSVIVSADWVRKNLGSVGWSSILRASVFGVPLPLCSCGVLPVAASLRKHGAGKGATTAFLLSTPQTGVDSIAVTYALLGPLFALFRPLAALITGFVGGGLVHVFDEPITAAIDPESAPEKCTDSCCTSEGGKVGRALRHGFITLPRDIGLSLLVGVLIAGVLASVLDQNSLAGYVGGGVSSILLMILAGIPLYVCATASVPIAAGLMYVGASPGAALAFLIAGPATNAAAFTTIWKILGRKSATLYLLTVGMSALGCGLLLNRLAPVFGLIESPVAAMEHGAPWYYHVAAVVLLLVFAVSYLATAHHQGEPQPGHKTANDCHEHEIETGKNDSTNAACAKDKTCQTSSCCGKLHSPDSGPS